MHDGGGAVAPNSERPAKAHELAQFQEEVTEIIGTIKEAVWTIRDGLLGPEPKTGAQGEDQAASEGFLNMAMDREQRQRETLRALGHPLQEIVRELGLG